MSRTCFVILWAVALLGTGCVLPRILVKEKPVSSVDQMPYDATSLTAINKGSGAWFDSNVEFEALYAGTTRVYFPGITRYYEPEYLNFGVWDPETQLWEPKDRKAKAFVFLYIPRWNTELTKRLKRLKRFSLIRIWGRVTDLYAGTPVIAVDDVQSGEGG